MNCAQEKSVPATTFLKPLFSAARFASVSSEMPISWSVGVLRDTLRQQIEDDAKPFLQSHCRSASLKPGF